jgi:hypothetical protein
MQLNQPNGAQKRVGFDVDVDAVDVDVVDLDFWWLTAMATWTWSQTR